MNVFVRMHKLTKNGQHLKGTYNTERILFKFPFVSYFRIVTSVKNNADKVQLDLSRLPSFEKILGALEGQLLDGRIFQVKEFQNSQIL